MGDCRERRQPTRPTKRPLEMPQRAISATRRVMPRTQLSKL